MKKILVNLFVVLIPFSLIACSPSMGTDITKEAETCDGVEAVWLKIKADTLSDNDVITQIKNLGSRWTYGENSNLKESLKDISNYNLIENLRKNYVSQSATFMSKVVATELVYKLISVNLACNQVDDIFYKPFDQEEIDRVILNLTDSRPFAFFNGAPSSIFSEDQ
jgi:hypothetical protein